MLEVKFHPACTWDLQNHLKTLLRMIIFLWLWWINTLWNSWNSKSLSRIYLFPKPFKITWIKPPLCLNRELNDVPFSLSLFSSYPFPRYLIVCNYLFSLSFSALIYYLINNSHKWNIMCNTFSNNFCKNILCVLFFLTCLLRSTSNSASK